MGSLGSRSKSLLLKIEKLFPLDEAGMIPGSETYYVGSMHGDKNGLLMDH